jgi:hypothetical protein
MGILRSTRRSRAGNWCRLGAAALSIGGLWFVSNVELRAKEVPLEYQVKAVYLFNFAKFVEWPAEAPSGPLTICVAGDNPFGSVLDETVRGETVNGRLLVARIIPAPQTDCHMVFVPQGATTAPYLRAAQGLPILTIGETPDFLKQGGMISFILEGGKVRFQIDSKAAERAELRISSNLLRLARTPEGRGAP